MAALCLKKRKGRNVARHEGFIIGIFYGKITGPLQGAFPDNDRFLAVSYKVEHPENRFVMQSLNLFPVNPSFSLFV